MSSVSHSTVSCASISEPSSSGELGVVRSVSVSAGGSGSMESAISRLGNSARIILFLCPNTAFTACSAVRLSSRSAHSNLCTFAGAPRWSRSTRTCRHLASASPTRSAAGAPATKLFSACKSPAMETARESIYYCEGTYVVPATAGATVVLLGGSWRAAVSGPPNKRAFVAEFRLCKKAHHSPLVAELIASGFRSATGAWASVADFEAAGRPCAWMREACEDGVRVHVPEDGAVALAWLDNGHSNAPLCACVVARSSNAEAPVGAMLRDAAFDSECSGALLLAALGAPAVGKRCAVLVTPPGAPHFTRLCANRDRLRAFALGWFGAQLSALPAENEKVFSAFDKARSQLDDR
ncbi:virion protein-like protein [Seal parapoxvirus]|uniref:Virion protein-like protein n=1 Tax=Seal parapoxvirus TaxID=187984 RepID=A0A1Z3GCU0_9POXV|nr:virion protein-like protein [Seal parapoxvirus]ASC55574.2 virion protein-like protein [Seal parapoxvirus]